MAEPTRGPTLEEMAQAHERGRQQLADAEARVEELRGPWEEACGHRDQLAQALKLIGHGMANAHRQHAIERALDERGVSYVAPLIIAPETTHERMASGVYARTAELVAVGPEGTGLYRTFGWNKNVSGARQGRQFKRLDDDGKLIAWGEHRGSIYSDPYKPKPPPEGGKWRWLKVREQEALTT
jgi:hypothetical protein